MSLARMLLCLTLPSLGACEIASIAKPAAPDASAILASFDLPTGSVAGRSPAEQTQTLREPLAALLILCGFSSAANGSCADAGVCQSCRMTDVVSRSMRQLASVLARERRSADAGEPLPEIPGASGLVYVKTVCDGWEQPKPDPTHGHYEFEVGFTGRGIDPAGTGRIEQCELVVDGRAVRATGSLFYTFAPATVVPFERVQNQPIVIGFEGTVQLPVDSRSLTLKAAVRSEPDRPPVLSFEVPGIGSFLATFDQQTVDVQGRDQRLRCQLSDMLCDVISPR